MNIKHRLPVGFLSCSLFFTVVFAGSNGYVCGASTAAGAYTAKVNALDSSAPGEILKLARWAWEKYGDVEKPDVAVLGMAISDLTKAIETVKKKGGDTLPYDLLLVRMREEYKKSGGVVKPDNGSGSGSTPASRGGKDVLDDRDIKWIRLQELTENDRVQVSFKNDAITRYIEKMRGNEKSHWNLPGKEDAFKKYTDTAKALEIRENMGENADFLKNIHVMGDPLFMKQFVVLVWPIVRQRCASPACHGGKKSKGGLRFVTDSRMQTTAGRYTNFAIISGFVGSRDRRLLERQDPKMSLLLQFTLDGKISELKHPKLTNKKMPRALFKSTNDPRYVRIRKWIKSLNGPLHPDYHIAVKHLHQTTVRLKRKEAVIPGL